MNNIRFNLAMGQMLVEGGRLDSLILCNQAGTGKDMKMPPAGERA